MDNVNKGYVEAVMKERGWVRLEETNNELYLSGKPAYDGGAQRPITLNQGALIFRKGHDSTEQIAIVSSRATTIYLFKGTSKKITDQKDPPWPEVADYSWTNLINSAEADTVLGDATNKTSESKSSTGEAPKIANGDIMDAIRQSAGQSVKSYTALVIG